MRLDKWAVTAQEALQAAVGIATDASAHSCQTEACADGTAGQQNGQTQHLQSVFDDVDIATCRRY